MQTPPPVEFPPEYPQYRPLSTLTTRIPLEQAKGYWHLPYTALKLGIHLVAGPGAGKSRLLGRLLAWQAVCRHQPLVVIDPTGATIDNLLDCIVRLPEPWRQALWPRITYLDVGATDSLTPTPLYYRLSDQDTLFAIANRFPSILKKQDPELQSAPILGWNSLYECAIHAGMIAAALGKQVDFVADLVAHPGRYKEELKQALGMEPALAAAVDYFREIMDPTRTSLREKRTGSFQTKLLPFVADPLLRATFSGRGQGLDWEKVGREGHTVLIDLRHVRDPEQRQFAMLWHFKAFTDYIKHRGMAGRGQEILLLIDEVSQMLAQRSSTGHSLLAEDLEELVAVLSRNYGVNTVISHQNLSQLEPRIQNVLLQMGTQVIGRVVNPEDALLLAKSLLAFDPQRVKKWETQWMALPEGTAWFLEPQGKHFNGQPYQPLSERTIPFAVDVKTTEYTADEQYILLADQIKALPRFAFFVKTATTEGTISNQVRRLSIERFDAGQYPHEPTIAYVRSCLRHTCGVPVEQLLAEIAQRRPPAQSEPAQAKPKANAPKPKPLPKDGTIPGDAAHVTANHALSDTRARPDPSEGSVWQTIEAPARE